MARKQKRAEEARSCFILAERVGFEPTVGLHLRLISSQGHSTTLPPLREGANYSYVAPLWLALLTQLVSTTHVRPQNLWNGDGAVCLLVILKHSD